MNSDTKWLDAGLNGRYTKMNNCLALTAPMVDMLADDQLSPQFWEVLLGDYTKWVSGLIFFPIDVVDYNNIGYIKAGTVILDVTASELNMYETYGYTMGEYFYEPKYGDFRDYEPYSTLEIYLPFYGIVDVPIIDVINKYIQFRLYVDFMTGQALYVIGVNDNSVPTVKGKYSVVMDDSNTRIIGKYSFTLGAHVPIGQSGMAETIRNISMAVIKGGLEIASAVATIGAGLNTSTSVSTAVATKRNPKTGRQITSSTKTKTDVYDYTNMIKSRAVTSCFEAGYDALNSMTLRAEVDSPNNPFVDFATAKSIKIIRKTAKIKDVDSEYNSLYGKPLGETRLLSNVHGYTEVSAIHFEGVGFSIATNDEMGLLDDMFSSGIILP